MLERDLTDLADIRHCSGTPATSWWGVFCPNQNHVYHQSMSSKCSWTWGKWNQWMNRFATMFRHTRHCVPSKPSYHMNGEDTLQLLASLMFNRVRFSYPLHQQFLVMLPPSASNFPKTLVEGASKPSHHHRAHRGNTKRWRRQRSSMGWATLVIGL